jgi:hypothetical protein
LSSRVCAHPAPAGFTNCGPWELLFGARAAVVDFCIGCIMIAAPVFFAPDESVSPPSDWAPSGIQQGKRYDPSVGEGNCILRECIAQACGGGPCTVRQGVPWDRSRHRFGPDRSVVSS